METSTLLRSETSNLQPWTLSSGKMGTSVPVLDARPCVPATIDELIRQRALEEGCDEPAVAYPTSGTNYTHYTPLQIDGFASRAASYYSSFIPQRTSSKDPVRVVGLLGPSNFEYLVTLLAISRLGHTVLFLSTRITKEAYVGLCKATNAVVIVVSPNFRDMGNQVCEQCPATVVPVCVRSDYEDLASSARTPLPFSKLDPSVESNNVAWIIHSSGSTGLPKPIYQTHAGALKNYANNFSLRGFITLPLFHAHGISCLFRAIHSKKTIYMYNADLPLTAPHLIAILRTHKIEILYAVPYALKLLAENEEGSLLLSSLELVMFGGSVCPKPIGDKLVAQGVHLVSHYGTTETGQLMTSFRDRSDKNWDYVRPTEDLKPFLRWEEQSKGIFELVVLEGWPSKVASNRPDNSYATKDLFEKHPTMPDAWRYYARLDDTLVLENGEKANPLLVEGVARDNRDVAEAVAFGANKPRLGLMIIPAAFSGYSTDQELVESIWPVIEKANAAVPAFSQISKDMIKVLPKSTEYRKTDKGTVIRPAFYRDFKDLIEEAYLDTLASGSMVLNGQELIAFLRQQLKQVAVHLDDSDLQDDTDLFSLGVDSLQSIRLRSTILQYLDLGGRNLPQNFVFEFPSLSAMAVELTRIRLGSAKQQQPTIEERMTRLIQKYSDFGGRVPAVHSPAQKEVIALTGATGSLGAHIAALLASSSTVDKVYCFVRASSVQVAHQRVRQSLQERRLYHTLPLTALRKLIALPIIMYDPQLGLDAAMYGNIQNEITGLIHCAWSVNFNLGLESFEKDCIAGTRHLIDLCLGSSRPSPARFVFCSSVSAVAATPGNVAPEDLPPSLLHAQNMGYAQSKLVTEHICKAAATQTGMVARVLRVGQIVGDTKQGVWNATEAIPMIFQTAETIGALPELDESPSWTPVDVVAKSVVEISMSDEGSNVVNVVNPTLFHWTSDLLPMLRQAGLQFESVPQKQWVARLRESNQDPKVNPPVKLVEFFASKYDNDEKRRKLAYEDTQAQKQSPALRNVGKLNQDLIRKFITYFRSQCWNSPNKPSTAGQNVIICAGSCGTRKTTIAKAISNHFSIPFVEGDDNHCAASRERMKNNLDLSDADRLPWLDSIRQTVIETLQKTSAPAVVVTCSALRASYRAQLRKLTLDNDVSAQLTMKILLMLSGDEEMLKQRVAKRHEVEGHYMQAEMINGPLDLLEMPGEDEVDIVPIDSQRPKEVVIMETLEVVKEILGPQI